MKKIVLALFYLVVPIFSASAPPTVTSISALQLLPPGAYPTVILLGYNTPGDGGGGILNWISSSTKSAAACSVYVPSSNPAIGRWERNRSSKRSNLQCGGSTLADTLSGPKTYPDLAGVGTRMVVVDANGTTSTQSIPAGSSLANPTATIGLTAVNGSATSGMRSDGAPALSQAISPTWSGNHTFSNNIVGNGGLTVADNTGVTSSISASTRTLIARAGTVLNIGENGGWTAANYNVITGGSHSFGVAGTTRFSINASGATSDGGLVISGTGSAADAKLYMDATNGLSLRGKAGLSYDFTLFNPSASPLLRNPTGTTTVEIPPLAGSGTRMVVADAGGALSTQTIPAGASLANPTATIGLSAVNGVSTSGLRSDGAPALSQAIAPTWTGKHAFTDSVLIVRTVANSPNLSIYTSNNPSGGNVGGTLNLGFGNPSDHVGIYAVATQSGAWSSTNKAADMVFSVLDPGDASPSVHESMRLGATGNLLVGTTVDPGFVSDEGSIIANANVQSRYGMYAGSTSASNGFWMGDLGVQQFGMYRDNDTVKFKVKNLNAVNLKDDGSAYFNYSLNATSGFNLTGGNIFFSPTALWITQPDGVNRTWWQPVGTGGQFFSSGGWGDIYYDLPTASKHRFQINDADVVTIGSGGLSTTAPITHKATRSLPSTVGPSAGTVTLDVSASAFFRLDLFENVTLAVTNASSGASFLLRLRQDATGGRTVSYPAAWRFPGNVTPALSTAANAIDYLAFMYDETDDTWDYVGSSLNMQ